MAIRFSAMRPQVTIIIERTNALHKRESFVLVRRFLNTAGRIPTLKRAIEGRSTTHTGMLSRVIVLRGITLTNIKMRHWWPTVYVRVPKCPLISGPVGLHEKVSALPLKADSAGRLK